jgi:kynurenine formamidase
MRLIDLTHSTTHRSAAASPMTLVVRSVDAIHLVPLDKLVTLATVVELRHRTDALAITRGDVAGTGIADIAGCILRSGWSDAYLAGIQTEPPKLDISAAAYLLEGGVSVVAADFPIAGSAEDMLLHNNCVLVHCLSNLRDLRKGVVRLIALPLKFEDTFSAEARVIAVEE